MQTDLCHELNDREWAVIQTLLSEPDRPVDEARRTIDGILWVMHTGHDWSQLPYRYGPYKSIQERFYRWAESGLMDKALDALEEREAGSGTGNPQQAREFAA